MAEELGIAITVEGVENERQLELIRAMGRCHVQGWLISKALPAAELLDFVQGYRAPAAARRGRV
jgi:sensor c-di-GMP phosphodiesterase-like protein